MQCRYACADFTFPLLTHDQALYVISLLGFDGVDIGLFAGRSHLRPETALTDVSASARALTAKVRERGLQIADIFLQQGGEFPILAANHPEAADRAKSRDVFLRALEFVTLSECRHMTGLPGIDWDGETHAVSLERSADELAWRVAEASQAGVVFSIEPHLDSVAPTPADALRLASLTPGLTFSLDYTHFIYQGFAEADVDPLAPHASHFHARGAAKGRLQTPVKDNVIDYPRVLKLLGDSGYGGYVGLEYVWIDWQGCNECDNLSETILLRDLLRRSQTPLDSTA